MKNFFKIFIFFMIIFLSPKVFAATYNVSSKVEAIPNFGGGTYYAEAPVAVPVPLYQNIGTRYNGTLSYISFYLKNSEWDWDYNTTYTITLNMATEDWRNHFMGPIVQETNDDGSVQSTNAIKYVSGSFRFVSYKTIKFNFKTGPTMGVYTKFTIYSGNVNTIAFTGVSNYNLSNISISTTTSPPTPTPVGPTPTPSIGNQDIIDNNTQNTQDIIDNNTQNTADIIENNNQNTQNIIDNQNSIFKDCSQDDMIKVRSFVKYNNSVTLTVADEHGINWTGQGATGLLFYQVIPVAPYTRYNLNYTRTNVMSDFRVYVYKGQAEFTGSNIIGYDTTGSFNFDTGLTNYITVGFYTPTALSSVTYRLRNITLIPAEPICGSKLDSLNEGINNLNDTMKNDNIDNGLGGSFFSDFDNQDFGLSSIITIPLTTIQSLTSKSCVALNVPIPFTNSSVPLPCMTEVYEQNVPTIYNLWKIVSFGIIAYFIAIDIFHMVKGFKDPESDKVEVLDL